MKQKSNLRSGVIAAFAVNMLFAVPVFAVETSTGHIDYSRILTAQELDFPQLAATDGESAEGG